MAYFFNPLLRDLLQKKEDAATPGDIDRLQGEIDTINENITTINGNLKNKVPKFFASIEELEIGEIGEYQGESNETFTHGNFYERGSGVLTPVFTEVDTVTLLRTKNLSGYSGLELPLYQTKLDGELPLLYSFDDDEHFYSLNIYPSAFGLPISYGSFVAFVCPTETGIISDCYLDNFQFANRIVTGYLTHFYYQGQEFLNKFENGNLYILYDGIWYPLLSIVQGGGSRLLNIYQCYMFQDNHLVEGVLLYDFSTTLALNTTATNHAAYAFYASIPPSFDLSFWTLISDTTSLFEFQLVLSPSVTCVGFATIAQGRYADTALQTITASGSGYISLTASAKSGDAGAKTQSISGSLTIQDVATAYASQNGLATALSVKNYTSSAVSKAHDQNTDTTIVSPDGKFKILTTNNAIEALYLNSIAWRVESGKVYVGKFFQIGPNAAFDSNASVAGNLSVSGNLNVTGKETVTEIVHVKSENDTITLRKGAQTAVASGSLSGTIVENYDGLHTNLVFGTDAAGVFRIGDENGTLEPLLTRNESANLTAGDILTWDAANQRAVGSPISTILNNFASSELITEAAYQALVAAGTVDPNKLYITY